MISPTYNIKQFEYKNKILYGIEEDLVPHGINTNISFPNETKQFYIRNFDTDNYRRFRIIQDIKDRYVFISEDGIICVVYKNI